MRMWHAWALLILFPYLSSCASVAEGVTKGLIESSGQAEQPLNCEITGPAFEGLAAHMRRLETQPPAGDKKRTHTTKVMLVHGMGSPESGYSMRLQKNLTRTLGLTVVTRRPKEIKLRSQRFQSEHLGEVKIWRYLNDKRTRELLFYELNWSDIVDEKKQALAYDTSGEHGYKRASFNQVVKEFLNSHMSDPLIYTGSSHGRILESVIQGSCWMFYSEWDELPDEGTRTCDWVQHAEVQDFSDDEFVYITHSMGSRIVVDTLQRNVEEIDKRLDSELTPKDRKKAQRILGAFQNERIHIFMMANQLPLMQLGRDTPKITGKIGDYCREDGPTYHDRILNDLLIVAFSDPNDVLSYAIPPEYADRYMDSRLCPTIVNASINIVPVTKIFKIGEVANPFEAHQAYDNDPRIIELITQGIDEKRGDQAVPEGCTWMRTLED